MGWDESVMAEVSDSATAPVPRDALRARVLALITETAAGVRRDDARDQLLWDLGVFQRAHVPAYARLWASRSARSTRPTQSAPPTQPARPDTRWAPAVPTDVFRYARMAVHAPAEDKALFRTSGTTSGARGEHALRDLGLYHHAAERAARRMLFPDLDQASSMRLLSVTPSGDVTPDSSLSHMLSCFFDWFADDDSRFCTVEDATGVSLPDASGLVDALRAATSDRAPVALLGTSFALVHVLDTLTSEGIRLSLPAGSRVMQTGGFKGKTREIAPDEMRAALTDRLGVPAPFIVAEYGMTELSSQMYETTLRDALLGQPIGERALWVPPWVRATPVDPEHLEPRPAGETGLLRIDDVANLDTIAAIQTSDLARAVRLDSLDDHIVLLGRASGAVARGCSLALEEALGS